MSTPWGRIPVVSIEDLVALKLTRRLADYDVISNLVRARLDERQQPPRALLRWALVHTYRAEDRVEIGRQLGQQLSEDDCRRTILEEIGRLQALDADYWRRVIDDLRTLRAGKRLIPEGTTVASLLPTSMTGAT
jgi:hypothetical protein